MVEKITGKQLNSMIKDGTTPLIIDCYADWCGPCKTSSPMFATLSLKYKNKARFVKINIDEEQKVSQVFKVRAVPSFFILRGKKVKIKIEGANLTKLENELIKELKEHYL